jgi:hypothetical protein
VTTADTLAFSAAGAFTGHDQQSSSQSYFAVDGIGRCYSRTVESKAGLVSAIRDGEGCL